jgi:adenine-specific DNA-methyltransferase
MPRAVRAYDRKRHAAARTTDYLFSQLIPYIGNKRKLLPLLQQAIARTGVTSGDFLDMFAGSGVVSRLAKQLGYRVISNDWEPYAYAINRCYIACNEVPLFASLGGYERTLETLNNCSPCADWVTENLCPRNDEQFDLSLDRLFYMRKNGMRIDAIREDIAAWRLNGVISEAEEACLLAPLLYQASYNSNTSGVFKAFHKGWGGQTKTALYRIAGDLRLNPAVFWDNGQQNEVFREDAQQLAERLAGREVGIAYLDPPYNQHPYGANYHVLNSVTLWDKPFLGDKIKRGNKSAIRLDWRTERRSAYNYKEGASTAYSRLLDTLNARYVLTSYSTDGMIPLRSLLAANAERGSISVEMQSYKRYRVSSQRFSEKPMNVECVLVLDARRKADVSVDELEDLILGREKAVLENHREYQDRQQQQMTLLEGE